MFDIEYKGGNGVIISTKKLDAVIDPRLSVVGLKDLPVKDTLEIATEARFATGSRDTQLSIEGPGDYELGPFSIHGVAAQRHIDTADTEKLSTIYRIEVGEVRLAVLGNIDAKLSEDQLEGIGLVDILILPVGGAGYTLDATSAASLVRQIDPKVIIPVHYADNGLTYEVSQDTLETFVKELGAPVETTARYKVKTAAALPATLTVVEVTRS